MSGAITMNSIQTRLDEFFLQKNIITDYQLQPYNIKLNTPWKSASSCLHYRQGLLIHLTINGSTTAIGECAPIPEAGTETLAQAQNFFFHKLKQYKDRIWDETLLTEMELLPACHFSLESILLSFIADQQKTNIAHLFNPHAAQSIKANTMLGVLDKDTLLKVKQAEQQGFSCIKFKLACDDYKTEIHQLLNLLKHIQTDTIIRLDANKSWSFEQTLWILNELQPYQNQIDSIEEPLLKYDHESYQILQQKTSIQLALDESFSSIVDLKQYPLQRLILKPTVQGGIINTLKLATSAAQYKIEIIITSSIETGYGLDIISQCCAALNNDHYHGIATANWLDDTLIPSPVVQQGQVIIKPFYTNIS